MAGNRTRVDCLEGNHANHYTTIASIKQVRRVEHDLKVEELVDDIFKARLQNAQLVGFEPTLPEGI